MPLRAISDHARHRIGTKFLQITLKLVFKYRSTFLMGGGGGGGELNVKRQNKNLSIIMAYVCSYEVSAGQQSKSVGLRVVLYSNTALGSVLSIPTQ